MLIIHIESVCTHRDHMTCEIYNIIYLNMTGLSCRTTSFILAYWNMKVLLLSGSSKNIKLTS